MWSLNKDRCVSCGECARACPLQSLEMGDGFPRMKEDAVCILCWTCADTCPEQAIELSMDKPAPSGASPDNL